MQWARQIEYEDLLEGDACPIYERCGEDTLLALLEVFAGKKISLKSAPVEELKRRYIREQGERLTDRELSIRLDVPQSFVEDARD